MSPQASTSSEAAEHSTNHYIHRQREQPLAADANTPIGLMSSSSTLNRTVLIVW